MKELQLLIMKSKGMAKRCKSQIRCATNFKRDSD